MDDYHYYGKNRDNVINQRGSGGVGILVNRQLFQKFHVEDHYVSDGIIGLKLTNKITKEIILTYCVYLSPDSSKYGKDNEVKLNNLALDIYGQSESDNVIIFGDFNARLGNRDDTLSFDGIGPRRILDKISNSQGDKLLNFVHDIRGVIVNGRISPEYDGFTSIASHKGNAVVDYFIVQQSDIGAITRMRVLSCTELIENGNKSHLVSDVSRIPDHNMIQLELEMSGVVRESLIGRGLGTETVKRQKIYRKIGENYMSGDTAQRLLPQMIENIENNMSIQNEVDECYELFVNFLREEAEDSLKAKNKKRKTTKYKEYWNKDLSFKWKFMASCERAYRQTLKKGSQKEIKDRQREFKIAQRSFDKTLKKRK